MYLGIIFLISNFSIPAIASDCPIVNRVLAEGLNQPIKALSEAKEVLAKSGGEFAVKLEHLSEPTMVNLKNGLMTNGNFALDVSKLSGGDKVYRKVSNAVVDDPQLFEAAREVAQIAKFKLKKAMIVNGKKVTEADGRISRNGPNLIFEAQDSSGELHRVSADAVESFDWYQLFYSK